MAISCKWWGIHTCYFFKQMWNNTKYAILNIDNLNTKMSEIQSVWDKIKECKKTCNWRYMFFSWIEHIFFRIDVVITMYIINPAQFWGHILIFFEKVHCMLFSLADFLQVLIFIEYHYIVTSPDGIFEKSSFM